MKLKEYCEREKKQYLLEEWDIEKNLPLTPETANHTSCAKVWWKCANGHSWQTQLRSRSASLTRCPHCFEEELSKRKKAKK